MTSLETLITQLSDQRAIQLLNRLLHASGNPKMTASARSSLPAALASSLSLPDEKIDAPSAGQLARAVLLLLAADSRHRDGIAALLDHAAIESFAPAAETALEPLAVLQVLNTTFRAFDPEASGTSRASSASQPGQQQSVAQQLLAFAGLRQTGVDDGVVYPVWYATTRRPLDMAKPALGFGVERDDDSVHYGKCTVFVPRSHKMGSIGSPWWKRTATFTDDRLKLLSLEHLAGQAFWSSVTAQLASVPEQERDAVVFVHGFNVDFQEAALRAAQIGFDLQVKGAMAFYSWASRGEVGKYLADEAAIELDEDVIADYLCQFAQMTGARRVHVIAHSMGNRAVLRAVNRIARDAQRRSGIRFGQFILAAPDVDARKFVQLSAAYAQLSERTTLYVSKSDVALGAAAWLHDFPRAGLLPPVLVADGIDTVNVSNVDLTLLGHGYVAEARDVLGDMHRLISAGAAPAQRFGLRAAQTEQGKPYWLIGA